MSQKFSLTKRAKSFTHAGRGLWLFISGTHNAWLHVSVFVVALLLGWYLKISQTEWLFVFLAAGLVFVTEAINTAIEIDIELTSPEFHPHARDSKDVAAGAVLLAAMTAAIVGVIIFLPKIIGFIRMLTS
jgi:diacylglycerol kinase (ATP)